MFRPWTHVWCHFLASIAWKPEWPWHQPPCYFLKEFVGKWHVWSSSPDHQPFFCMTLIFHPFSNTYHWPSWLPIVSLQRYSIHPPSIQWWSSFHWLRLHIKQCYLWKGKESFMPQVENIFVVWWTIFWYLILIEWMIHQRT